MNCGFCLYLAAEEVFSDLEKYTLKRKSTKKLNCVPLLYLRPQLYRIIWFIIIIY